MMENGCHKTVLNIRCCNVRDVSLSTFRYSPVVYDFFALLWQGNLPKDI